MTIRSSAFPPPVADPAALAPRVAGPGLRWWPGRPASRAGQGGLIAVNLAAITFFLLSYSPRLGLRPYRIDLDVYRIGSQAWLHGGDLYGTLPATASGLRLPFSYPPIAAVLLAPLSLVPMAVAAAVLTLATIALTAVVLRVFLRSLGEAGSWWTAGWLLPVALLLEPVRNTLSYGQVNVVLMALVALDCLTRQTRWPRGALVGIAAAVKLTPAAFLLFFLLRRDYRAAGMAMISFAVSTGAGLLLAPGDSARYWTSVVFQTSRPGSAMYAANQSVQGVLARAGIDPHAPAGLATGLAASVIVIALAWCGMRRALARGHDSWALSLNAFAALLISPVSWSHHWVWGEPALLVLALVSARGRRRGGLLLAAAGLVIFAAAPQWWFPSGQNREVHWPWWEQAAGSSYVLLALVILAVAAVAPPAARRSGPGREAGELSARYVNGW